MDLATVLQQHRNIRVDRTLLTADQLREYDQWQEFFHGPVWRDLIQRYEPNIHALQNSYHTVQGEQMLGRVQGSLTILYNIFEHLPDMIHLEYLQKTGQISDDDPSDEDLVDPGKWDA